MAAFGVLVAACALAAAPQQERSVREIARTIADEKGEVDPALFAELAAFGTEASLRALDRARRHVDDDERRAALQAALVAYADDAELGPEALALLAEEAEDAREPAWRVSATRTLPRFGEPAVPALERIALEHDDAACRGPAVDVLVVRLLDEHGERGLEAVLRDVGLHQDRGVRYLGASPGRLAPLANRTHRSVVRELLGRALGPRTLDAFADRLAARDAGRVRKLFLLRLVAERTSVAAGSILAARCDDEDPAVALLAVDLLMERPRLPGAEEALRPLLRSREPALRRAGVLGLGKVLADDSEFEAEALALARSRDDATRMGAAGALVDVGSDAALEALHALVADDAWPVRVEALRRVGTWRRGESLPVLVGRMRAETGRMRPDVRAALVRIARVDLGRRPEAWERWWESEGAHFEVPPVDAREVVVDAAEQDEGETEVRRFYSLRVLSERVAFVLDVSGSMRNRSERSVGAVETTRMDVAKEELAEVLRKLPEGTLFNVIFFESQIRPLEEELVEMEPSTRARALRFVRDQYAVGGTALYPALELAFADPLVDTIYLLSDGAPTEGDLVDIEEIRAEVNRWNAARHVRIHGVAMGQDSTLLRWLCEDTGGTYRRVD